MRSKFLLLIILAVYSALFASSDVKVISSSTSSLIFDYYPEYSSIDEVSLNNSTYLNITLKNGFSAYSDEYGKPNVPLREIMIGVPSENGYTIQILDTEYSVKKGKLVPVKDIYATNSNPLQNDEIYNSEIVDQLVLSGDAGYFRDQLVSPVNIYPVQFNQSKNEIKLYKRIRVKVNFNARASEYSKINDDLVNSMIINYNAAKNWGKRKTNQIGKVSSTSTLSNGTWYRFEAPDEGMYRISRDKLSELGIDAGNIDPRTIKIYNNGGYQMSEAVSNSNPDDLVEVAIKVVGENDGSFDSDDYILFYGRGVDFFELDEEGNVVRNRHQYDVDNWYWITSGGSQGKRAVNQASLNTTDYEVQNSTEAYVFHEENLLNIHKSGRLFVADEYTTTEPTHTYVTSLPNIVGGTQVNYIVSFVNHSRHNIPFSVQESGSTLLSTNSRGNTSSYGEGRVNEYQLTYNGNISDGSSVLKFSFNTPSAEYNGFMDFFEINYTSRLEPVDDVLVFYSEFSAVNTKFELSGYSNTDIKVYNITDYSSISEVTGVNKSGGEAEFIAPGLTTKRQKYIAVCANKFKSIKNIEQISNSAVKAETQGASYVIITHKKFGEQAERLANYRETQAKNPIDAKVIYVDEIFNEYSSGMVDVTAIRDFLMEAYNTWSVTPKYVLFFGDGNYDVFNVESYNENYIPTFETEESLNEVYSYSTDDYYCRISGSDKYIDIAHGRLPVNSIDDAEIIVDKIIKYESGDNQGLWRTKIAMVTDDHLQEREIDEGDYHNRQSETLATTYIPGFFNLEKIYLAGYPTVYVGAGRRKPDVNRAIVDAINNGVLMMSFIGHGNPKTWTHEYVFEKATTIPQLDNEHFFFLTAATCDFGRFDDPSQLSSNEEMLFLNNKGSIGSIAATRSVFAGLNAQYIYVFYSQLLQERDEENKPPRLGTAYLNSKMGQYIGSDSNSEKFHLFADPAMVLNEPSQPAHVAKVNGVEVDSTQAQLQALQTVNIEGEVDNFSGEQDSDFNGEAIISVFDSKKIIHYSDLGDLDIEMPGGVIFRGRSTVVNGKYTSSFTVPKDISYDVENGKIVSYVYDDNNDGIGFTNNVVFSGADSTVQNDGAGPTIEITYDNSGSTNAYLVNPNFTLRVNLSDETGLNTTGAGIGHKLEAIINDDYTNAIDLTNYFIGDLNAAGKSGAVEYKFSSMDPGEYKIQIKAWDVFNNFSTEESYFSVIDGNGLVLKDVANYPNPFAGDTWFTFQHNYTDPLNVKVKVYTVAGRKIKEFEEFGITDKFVKIYWDGRDADGDVLANGTYLYKLIVKTVTGDVTENYLGKLAIIR